MKIIEPYFEILTKKEQILDMLKTVELAARNCYKSEDRITEDSYEKFIRSIIKRNHTSVIEHCNVTVRIICDRGITHEIVRHRLASYSQESTRYANYSKDKFGSEITTIKPCFWDKEEDLQKRMIWYETMDYLEKQYMKLLELGATAQEARSILPNSLKSDIVATMNLRSWLNFFKLRCDKTAHPQIREIAIPLLAEFKKLIPCVFENLEYEGD